MLKYNEEQQILLCWVWNKKESDADIFNIRKYVKWLKLALVTRVKVRRYITIYKYNEYKYDSVEIQRVHFV